MEEVLGQQIGNVSPSHVPNCQRVISSPTLPTLARCFFFASSHHLCTILTSPSSTLPAHNLPAMLTLKGQIINQFATSGRLSEPAASFFAVPFPSFGRQASSSEKQHKLTNYCNHPYSSKIVDCSSTTAHLPSLPTCVNFISDQNLTLLRKYPTSYTFGYLDILVNEEQLKWFGWIRQLVPWPAQFCVRIYNSCVM